LREFTFLKAYSESASARGLIPSKNKFFDGLKYIIMPNHLHMIIIIKNEIGGYANGTMRTSCPTTVPNLLRSFKTMVSKEIGFSLWQSRYHDHIIRNEADYLRIWQYIDENPIKWAEDEYYCDV